MSKFKTFCLGTAGVLFAIGLLAPAPEHTYTVAKETPKPKVTFTSRTGQACTDHMEAVKSLARSNHRRRVQNSLKGRISRPIDLTVENKDPEHCDWVVARLDYKRYGGVIDDPHYRGIYGFSGDATWFDRITVEVRGGEVTESWGAVWPCPYGTRIHSQGEKECFRSGRH